MELAVDRPVRDRSALDHRRPSASPTAPGRDEALDDVLARLGERVRPVAMARERTLPLIEALHPIMPEAGLVRGRVMSCRGGAAMSIANSVVSEALGAGAWLAVVDVDTFGADAASEFGVPLERVVRVETGVESSTGTELDWIDVMGASIDGFDIVVTRVPASLREGRRPAAVRKLMSRCQQRGAVVVVLGDPGALTSDIDLMTERTVWDGLGDGSGHLRRRRIDIAASGRRAAPGSSRVSLCLTAAAQRVAITATEVTAPDVTAPDDTAPEVTMHGDDRRVSAPPLAG